MDGNVEPVPIDIESQLARRHRAAATTVGGLVLATILLSLIAYLSRNYVRQQANPLLEMAVKLLALFLGIGSIVWRRTKFSTMRLQDIAALQGADGLLRTLERTTLQIAFLGACIAVIGLGGTLLTGDETFTFMAAAVALTVLVYSYPTKSSWTRVVKNLTSGQLGNNPSS